MATETELWLVLWGVLFALAGYGAGELSQWTSHQSAHHERESHAACASAALCSTYAPRGLCAEWRDQPPDNSLGVES